jgi:hypothetical protein
MFREEDGSLGVVTRLGNSVRFQAEKTFSFLHRNVQTHSSSHKMKWVTSITSGVSLAAQIHVMPKVRIMVDLPPFSLSSTFRFY